MYFLIAYFLSSITFLPKKLSNGIMLVEVTVRQFSGVWGEREREFIFHIAKTLNN